MKSKIKVLHVLTLNSFGGIQTLILQLSSEFNHVGRIDSTIFSTQKVNLPKSIFPKNVNIIESKEGSIINKILSFRSLIKDYDVIHFHGPLTLFQIVLIQSNKKVVYTEHGTLQKANIKKTLKHFIQKRIIGNYFIKHRANAVIFISKWLEKDLNLNRKRCYQIYNGLEYKTPLITESNDVVLTIAARMVPKKRVDKAINVMKKLSEHKNIKLYVLGNGPEMNSLKEQAGKLLNETVFFLDYRSDAYDLIASSDFYLMTTDNEPFGLVVLEAMMNKTMVLTMSDSGGPVEILKNKFPSLICNTDDDMAEKILKFSSVDKKKYSFLCESLKEEYENEYTIQVMANGYENVYLNV